MKFRIFGFLCFLGIGILATRYKVVIVRGESMEPTLRNGDLLIVDNFAYKSRPPLRGEVVISHFRGELIVKRIVGEPGEKVEVTDGCVYVNGVLVLETNIRTGTVSIRPGILRSNRFALLGDNRSLDPTLSVHANVSRAEILGKVAMTFSFHDGPTRESGKEFDELHNL